MAAPGWNVDDDRPYLLQGDEMLCDTWLACADGIHDVAARRRAESREEPQYLVPCPVSKGGHGCLDVG
ncbi:hypothetical protein AUT26_08190 [[Arthrobacter] sp. ATCC 21022]|nr:hypothetical protein AUT26_08190 [Arthrobacter sp. ATCC 21022]KUR63413.1 hypothetical protein JM67_16775 [Arthrobacter sp. ATCC 21022]